MSNKKWLSYPPGHRIRFECSDASEPNIIIGNDKSNTKFMKWNCTFVHYDKSGEPKMIDGIEFNWEHNPSSIKVPVEKLYPNVSPVFDKKSLGGNFDKVNSLLDKDLRLKKWSSDLTIRQNLKEMYQLLK